MNPSVESNHYYCPSCDAQLLPDAVFCSSCGLTIGQAPNADAKPAGFRERVIATLIDLQMMAVPTMVLGAVIYSGLQLSADDYELLRKKVDTGLNGLDRESTNTMLLRMMQSYFQAAFFVGWPYFTIMESRWKQGTVGKIVMGLKVTDKSNRRIGFLRANGRYWMRLPAAMIAQVGFLMAAFTRDKQALHDWASGSKVVKV